MTQFTVLLVLTAVPVMGQFVPAPAVAQETQTLSNLEAAQRANPDDMAVTEQLLRSYRTALHDPTWGNGFALLSSAIQHHPEAGFLGSYSIYLNMPASLREQVKQLWIAQVHQHADNPAVLRNAAFGVDSQISIRVGGNVQQTKLINQISPRYPALAKQARIQGTVRFEVTISPEGRIQNANLVTGHPLLVTAAQEAILEWTYTPTLLNGIPVRVITMVDVNFTLQP